MECFSYSHHRHQQYSAAAASAGAGATVEIVNIPSHVLSAVIHSSPDLLLHV